MYIKYIDLLFKKHITRGGVKASTKMYKRNKYIYIQHRKNNK